MILIRIMLLLTFFSIYFVCISVNNALASSEKIKDLSLHQLMSKASEYSILITDWQKTNAETIFKVNLDETNDKKSWLDYLKKNLKNWAIVDGQEQIHIYLLPLGVDPDNLKKAQTVVKEIGIGAIFANIGKSERIKDIPLNQIHEIVVLQNYVDQEKRKTINFQRFIDSQTNGAAYDFKVRYDNRVNMLLPFEKNGKEVNGKMEGFSSYSTFYNFIEANAEKLEAYRYGEWVYLRLKGDDNSMMALSGTEQRIRLATSAKPEKSPKINIFLSGNQTEFHSVAKIEHRKGFITLIDIATLN